MQKLVLSLFFSSVLIATSSLQAMEKEQDNYQQLLKLIRETPFNHKALFLLIDKSTNKQESLNNALNLAVCYKHTDLARMLIQKGAQANCTLWGTDRPLHSAVFTRSIQLIQLLLENGAEINAPGCSGRRALTLAAEAGFPEMVLFLLLNNAQIDAQDDEGETALMKAVRKGHKEVVTILIKARANVNKKSLNGNTPLTIAVGHQKIELVKLLLEAKADINEPGMCNWTALTIAAHRENEALVALLLEHGADVNCMQLYNVFNGLTLPAHIDPSKNCYSPLTCSLQKNNTAIASKLIAAKANLNVRDVDGLTPLIKVIQLNNRTLFFKLLEAGSDVNERDQKGRTALMYAAIYGNNEAIEALLSKHTDIDHQDSDHFTALMFAVQNGHCNTVSLLLKHQAWTNSQSLKSKQTALMIAVEKDRQDIVVRLLKHGTDCQIKNDQGENIFKIAHNPFVLRLLEMYKQEHVKQYLQNPLTFASLNFEQKDTYPEHSQSTLMLTCLACTFGHQEVLNFLKERNLSPLYLNLKDEYGYTALDYALEYGFLDGAAFLINTYGILLQKVQNEGESLLRLAVEKGNLTLVNALLKVGVKPSIDLVLLAKEAGYLRIMLRLLGLVVKDNEQLQALANHMPEAQEWQNTLATIAACFSE